ncbi:MAG: recombinase family protein [Clostridia bacterium]
MIYGYARVSTKGQAKDGNSLEAQDNQLKENGAQIIYHDSFTGSKSNRPELSKLFTSLQAGDTLIVTKLDRMARSLSQGSQLITELIGKGVKVNILNIGIMDNTPSSRLIRNIFFSFAEFERDMIIERTQEGKAIAKQASDFKEGRPKIYNPKQLNHAIHLLEDRSYKQVSEMTGISKSTLIREVNKRKAIQ